LSNRRRLSTQTDDDVMGSMGIAGDVTVSWSPLGKLGILKRLNTSPRNQTPAVEIDVRKHANTGNCTVIEPKSAVQNTSVATGNDARLLRQSAVVARLALQDMLQLRKSLSELPIMEDVAGCAEARGSKSITSSLSQKEGVTGHRICGRHAGTAMAARTTSGLEQLGTL